MFVERTQRPSWGGAVQFTAIREGKTGEAFQAMTRRSRMLLVFLLAVIYAGCYAGIKVGLAYAPPFRFAGLRALAAGLAVLAFSASRGHRLAPPRVLWRATAAVALAGTVVGYGAMFMSPLHTGAGLSSVLGNTEPLLVIVLAAFVLGEHVTVTKALALGLGLAGISLIAYPALAGPTRGGVLSLAMPLAAAAGAATESVLVKRARPAPEALLAFVGWELSIGGALLLFFSAWVETGQVRWTPTFIALLSALALVGTSFTTCLWYWLIQRDEVGRLSLPLFAVPVLGLALAAVAFGERVGLAAALGVAVTLSGIAIVARDSIRGDDPPSTPHPRGARDEHLHRVDRTR